MLNKIANEIKKGKIMHNPAWFLSSSAHLRYFTGALTYFAQGIPKGLLHIALPAWLAAKGVPPAEVAGFLGVIIMARPSGQVYALGIAVALAAAFMHAVLQIILRYLGRYERPVTISAYFFIIGTFLCALPLHLIAVRPTWAERPLLLGVGLSGAAAQWLLSVAFRNARAAIVSVFNYSGIVWATLFGWMIWNDWPLPTVIAGAAIVIASNILMIWRESRLGRISDARFRAKL